MEQISKRRQQISGWLVVAVGIVVAVALAVTDSSVNDVLNTLFDKG